MLAEEIIPTARVTTFPNQKPWMDRSIRTAVNARTASYNAGLATGDMSAYKAASYGVHINFQCLQRQGIESPQVFLVSSFELHLYNFPLLHQTLDRDLPAHKRDALLCAMPNFNPEIIRKKKQALRSKVKYWATLSAAGAAVPVPGLSIAVDAALLVGVVTHYVHAFGLDIPSLKRLSARTGVPYAALCDVIISPLAAAKITKELLLKVIAQLGSVAALIVAEEVSRWIPFIGILVSAGLSFTTTYKILKLILDKLADDAQRVFERALG
ncbi:interferon-inducible GTPase 5-like [Pundamilia nyererei]|uniref:Interferon-inducible GTPase 5-like n=1 Tax=Pundamilia nyererei TaxID=303518 RepID=A0A9Y3S721_9CICH|nr:PREDICTED: interferon-inducible GTPase 5-like [Pundamilia nyererei]